MSAADRYKEVVAGVTAGVAADIERDKTRLDALRTEVPERRLALTTAADRRLLVWIAAEQAWEDALDVLWTQTKVTMQPFPKPSRFVENADLLKLAAEIEERAAALRDVVQGRKRP